MEGAAKMADELAAAGGEIKQAPGRRKEKRDYKGFVAGVFSGIMKLSGGC